MTVADLIATLEDFDPEATVVLAIQPRYPFEHSIGDIVEMDGKVYIAEAGQVDYLKGSVSSELGWR